MTHGSLFAGIGGFDLGFERAGFRTVWQVEQDRFCQAVLKTRFPDAERLSDVRECGKHNLTAVDVITAGFPCSDLSVAGKRAGLAGSRSSLFWEAARIVGELRPSWLVLENVPGLFSSRRGEDFAALLRGLGKLGCFRSIAWRVLDSQWFGVAQRRRRVFIVCGPGTGSAEQVLFEPESGARDSQESREAGQGASRRADGSLAGALATRDWKGADNIYAEEGKLIPVGCLGSSHGGADDNDARVGHLVVAYQLRSDPGGTGQGWNTNYVVTAARRSTDGGIDCDHAAAGQIVATSARPTSDADGGRDFAGVSQRLDDPLPEGMDSPRYRTLGNAVTVNVAEWIARRLRAVNEFWAMESNLHAERGPRRSNGGG